MTATVSEGNVTHLPDPASDDAIILQTLKILEARRRVLEWYVQNADDVKKLPASAACRRARSRVTS